MNDVLPFLHHIAPALITIIGGGFVLQFFLRRLAGKTDYINSLISQIESTREDALSYWSLDCRISEQRVSARILEQKIKGAFLGIATDVQFLHDHLKINPSFFDDINQSVTGFFNSCTSGAFEEVEREPDLNKYIYIAVKSCKLRSELNKAKLRIFLFNLPTLRLLRRA